jgi:CysZ protein
MQDFLRGFMAYFRALDLIGKHNFGRYFLYTGIVSIILGVLILGGMTWYVVDAVRDLSDAGIWESFWKGFWTAGRRLFWLALMLFGSLILYKNLILVVNGPFMVFLSEKVEKAMNGTEAPKLKLSQILYDNWRAIALALRNIALELLITIPLLLLNFIPGVGSVVSMISIFLVQAFYAGYGHFDFTLERKRYNVKESNAFARRNRMLATGVGAGFLLMLLIPFAGFIFAPTFSVTASTIVSVERMEAEGYKK